MYRCQNDFCQNSVVKTVLTEQLDKAPYSDKAKSTLLCINEDNVNKAQRLYSNGLIASPTVGYSEAGIKGTSTFRRKKEERERTELIV